MKYTHRSFKRAGFFTLALVLTLVSFSACGANNPIVDKILGDTAGVPDGTFFTSQVGKYKNNMHDLAPYINANREGHGQHNPIQATFLGNDFNEIRRVFIGKNGKVEDYSFVSLDMSMMDAEFVPEDCFNGVYVEADGVGEVGMELTAKIVEAWLPETVETLDARSFANNDRLAIVSMTGIKSIKGEAANFAFYNTKSLEKFYLPSVPPVCKGVFVRALPSAPIVIHVPEDTDLKTTVIDGTENTPDYFGWVTNVELLPRDAEKDVVEKTFIADLAADSEG